MQRWKKPLLILAGIIAGLFLLLVAASFLLADKAKSIAIDQINRNLSVPVDVKDIQFSLIRNFPYAAIRFEKVVSAGSATNNPPGKLADAESIFLLYNLTDLFSDELHLRKIIITNAEFFIYHDNDDNINYDILKDQEKSGSSSRIELEEVELNNVKVRYIDIPARRDYRITALHSKLKGAFTNEIYDLDINGPIFAERIKISYVNYLSEKPVDIKIALNINTKSNIYNIVRTDLRIADMNFNVSGKIDASQNGHATNITIQSREAGIRELLSLIPGVYTKGLDKYKYDGNVLFVMNIKDLPGKNANPLVTASFEAKDASLKTSDGNYAFRNIRLKGDYTTRISDSRPVSRLNIQQLKAILENQPIEGNLLAEDFSNPAIDMHLKSRINLAVLSKFWMPDTISSMNGEVNANAHIRGRSRDKNSWTSEGSLTLLNVSIGVKERKQHFTGINGEISLRGSQLNVVNLKALCGGSDFTFNGNFTNAYGYVLTKTENLTGTLNIQSSNIDLAELLELNADSRSSSKYYFDPDPRIHVSITCSAGMIQFRKFQAWQLNGHLNIDGKILEAKQLSFKGFEGNTLLTGMVNAGSADSLKILCQADVKRLDIQTLFRQLGNFGQNVIVAENVRGKLTATIQFAGMWSKDLNCNLDRIVSQNNLLIEDGELIKFQPIQALNKYIKGADFEHIRFSTLKNRIDIRNQTIFIPAMQIQSSAMDLTASGTHTFDNMVDYKLQMYLSQILGKKVKDQNTEFGYIEDDGLGRMKIYLTMKGPMANPKVVFDKKAVEQQIATGIRQERNEFKNIIRKEFGKAPKDSVPPRQTPKKKAELELDTEE